MVVLLVLEEPSHRLDEVFTHFARMRNLERVPLSERQTRPHVSTCSPWHRRRNVAVMPTGTRMQDDSRYVSWRLLAVTTSAKHPRRHVGVSRSCFTDISHSALHHANTDPNYG
jgi:hypothetical protein